MMKKLLKNISLSTIVLLSGSHMSMHAAAGSSYSHQQEPSAIHAWAQSSGGIENIRKTAPEVVAKNMYIKDHDGNIPLALAAKSGQTIIAMALLDKLQQYYIDQNKEIRDPHAGSPLLDIKNNDGNTILALAAKFGHDVFLTYLIEELKPGRRQVNIKNNQGYTPFELAIMNNHLKTAHILQENGASPVFKGQTVKIIAQTQQQAAPMAQLPTVTTATPKADKGSTTFETLKKAIDEANIKDALPLIQKHPKIGALKDSSNMSLLHYIAMQKDISDTRKNTTQAYIAAFLINIGGANIDELYEGKSALEYAALNGNLKLASILLEKGAGADIDMVTKIIMALLDTNIPNKDEIIERLTKR